jgi:hypothetical protein
MVKIKTKVYCVNCKHRYLEFWYRIFKIKDMGYCSHPEKREPRQYEYRQTDIERYPMCSSTNRRGECLQFERR